MTSKYSNALQISQTSSFSKWYHILHPKVAFEAPWSCSIMWFLKQYFCFRNWIKHFWDNFILTLLISNDKNNTKHIRDDLTDVLAKTKTLLPTYKNAYKTSDPWSISSRSVWFLIWSSLFFVCTNITGTSLLLIFGTKYTIYRIEVQLSLAIPQPIYTESLDIPNGFTWWRNFSSQNDPFIPNPPSSSMLAIPNAGKTEPPYWISLNGTPSYRTPATKDVDENDEAGLHHALTVLRNALPEEDRNQVMNASEFATLADECQIVEELSVRHEVSIVTDVQVESDDEKDAEEPFVAPTITALDAQEHLQRLARYCSGIERLSISGSFSAKISVSSPRKLFIFII